MKRNGPVKWGHVCWSLPAYSDNAIFCRNLKEIACVDIVAGEVVTGAVAVDAGSMGSEFRRFIDTIQAETNKAKRDFIITDFISDQSSFPIIEGDVAHFVYRGEGTDVAVASDIFGARQEKKMSRLAETDFFYLPVKLESDQRANYMFLVDYKPQTDPLNQRQTTSSVYAGEMEFAVRLRGEKPLEMSWFGMSEWNQPEYLTNVTDELAGSYSSEKFEIEGQENAFECGIYFPPGYDQDTATRFRTIYAFAMPGGRELGQLEKAVDQIFQSSDSSIEPAILVCISFPLTPNVIKPFVEKLIPAIDARYRTKTDRQSRTTVGFGFAGASAIGLATQHADSFCGAAVYSPLVFDAEKAMIEAAFKQLKQPMTYYVEWGRFDMFNPHENWDIRKVTREIYEMCEKTDGVTVSGGMVNDSTDWSSWRNRYPAFLKVGQEK